jgi:uridine phosphorylase
VSLLPCALSHIKCVMFVAEKRISEVPVKTRNDHEGLIRPQKGKSDPVVGPDAVLVMIRTDLDDLLSLNGSNTAARYDMGFFELYRIITENGAPLFLSGPFLGAPHAVMGMEKLIALGASRVWVMGWCGSLQPHLRIGHLVVPAGAISEEGTSAHYPIGGIPPVADEELNGMIEGALNKAGHSFIKGDVWTTDAPYRETAEKVEFYQKRGILAVEMEMSALMTLARYRGVRMGGILVVSDELFTMKWNAGFSNPELRKATRFAAQLLVGLAASKNG